MLTDWHPADPPAAIADIAAETERLGVGMASEPMTGALLRTLAASRPDGNLLELGTGTGLGTAWLLDGMTDAAKLTTVDVSASCSAVAARYLGADPRLIIVVRDATEWLSHEADGPYDLIFADSLPGKFEGFEAAWALLPPGGLYVIDDMRPQPNWPDGHGERVERLLADLDGRPDCALVRLDWATGIVVAVKVA